MKIRFLMKKVCIMLTQSEVDTLFAMPKKPKSNGSYTFSHTGSKLVVEFLSFDRRGFFLNI